MKTFHDPEVFGRVRRLPATVLGATDALRDAALARGVDVIDLAKGNPDVGAPEEVVAALREAAGDPRHHRYLAPRGLPRLREAAASWYARRHGVALDPDREVVMTLGSREGIGHALVALLQEGEAVLAPTPSHPVHAHGAALAGGETIPVPVGPGVDFLDSLVEASERAERRPRGLIVNFPSNPTGAVATPELLQKVVKFAEARDLFILSDLAHGDLVLDGPPAPSILQVPGARERTLEFVSLSKAHGMPGWRVGIAAGNAALAAALARVKSYLDAGLFGPVQVAAAVALERCDPYVAETRERYRRRRDALVAAFGAAGWAVPSPAATLFAWAPLPEPVRHLGSVELARRLLDDAGVAVVPGVAFGRAGEGHVRIALVEDEPRIAEAAARTGPLLARLAAEPRPSHTPAPRVPERA